MNNIELFKDSEKKTTEIKHIENTPDICPLTESQKGVYIECMNSPETVMYNIAVSCEIPSDTDTKKFKSAIKTVVKKHKALNVVIKSPDGVPSMIYKEADVHIEEKVCSDFEKEKKDFIKPFDLENGPLFRFEICKSNENLYLIFDIHHIVFDGMSINVLLSEITDAYYGKPLSPETLNIFDVALFENSAENSDEYKKAQKFFEDKFAGNDFDSKPIPDVVDCEEIKGAGRIILSADGKFKLNETEKFVREKNISEGTLFLGAFAYALAKFNGTENCAFSTANNGRRDSRLRKSIGMFVKTTPLYYDFSGDMPVCEYLRYIGNDFHETLRNDSVPFGELAGKYGANADVAFIYQANLFRDVPFGNGKITAELLALGECQSDLDVMLMKNSDGYSLTMHYNKAVYSKELIESFGNMYLGIIRGMLTSDMLSDISLTDSDSRKILENFNKTEFEYDGKKTVVELFKEQAQKTPEHICLVCKGKKYTYKQVDTITDILAKHLKKNGVGKEKVVGVLINRNEYMLIASMGVLKAGGAYLPLDPTYPPERLNLMVKDSGAMMLIYDKEYDGVITDDFDGIRLPAGLIPELKDDAKISLTLPSVNDLFVMLYTSGSTGTPKGVMFEHSNALVTTVWVKKYFGIDETSRVTSYASYGFDAHSFDIYPAVTSGAELHIITEDIRLDFPELRKYYNENKITHTVMTTQVGRQFALMGGLTTLKHLSVAGEKLTPLDVPENISLYNLYGPTEGSVITSAFKIEKKYKDVPIGLPVDNLKLYVVDKNGKLLPAGAVGELWIAGPHVTRGYLNRPEKTAEAYGENPFGKEKGYGRIYRTGDIVRLMGDGNLQFVGRRDAQVKVRGFRVELTEIEEVIRRFEGIKDATVAAFDDASGGKFIAAYVVSDTAVDTKALAEFIKSEKPPYMVPAVTMQIDKIPLNQNCKVNKKALPVPERKAADIVPPETEAQKELFEIIADIIGHKEFGITTDIYEAGLTSIGAIKLNVSLSDKFDIPVKIADIKENPTVSELEKFILSANKAEEYETLRDYPITFTQNGIFIECMANPETTVYNIPVLIKLGEKVDTGKLKTAVTNTLNAHPYIKTTLFTDETGSVRAKRNDSETPIVEIIDCKELPKEIIRPFNLLGGVLYRAEIYKTNDACYLFMDFHHIIYDGTSENIIFRDITDSYNGKALKNEVFTGFELALDEEKTRQSDTYKNASKYYENLLSGADTSCLPKAEPESKTAVAGNLNISGSLDVSQIIGYCAENSISQNAFFNGVFSFVLSRFSGKESLVYSTIYNGRNDSRLQNTVTMCVKTIPVAVNLADGDKITDFLSALGTQLVESMSNDIYSFGEIAGKYGVTSDIIFIYQGENFAFDSICGEKAELINISSDTAKAPVSVNVFIRNGKFRYAVEYDKSVYSIGFAEALADAVEATAKSFTESVYIKDVSMMSSRAEKKYEELNFGDCDCEKLPVHKLIENTAEKYPERTAVIAGNGKLTYTELNEKANTLAHALKKLGVKSDTIVGMVLDRTNDVFICELGILKSGGAFLPMIPTYPDERIDFCLTNAESPYVITAKSIKEQKGELFADTKPYKTLTVEDLLSEPSPQNLDLNVPLNSLAYCIYTSGSTGTPKGVMIEHRNFSGFLQTLCHPLNYYGNDDFCGTALASSSISFDMSIMELILPLCYGKSVYITSEDEFHNPLLMKELMIKNHAQMMICTPSFMNNMVSIPEFLPAIKELKTIVVGAEAFPSSLYETLRRLNPELQIINGYGPTETTICCSTKELESGENITIGKPTENVKFYVTDKLGHILPPYAIGELIICGESVGRGYVKLPEKTAAAFFTLRGLPAYHSGDLVRLTDKSEIDFGGRIDNQVKLRGFRIELDEIEKVMSSFEGVKQSKVLVRSNGSEDYLAGFFIAEKQTDIEKLTEFMKSRLTYYMVPAALMQIDAMPLTPNGKIDKNGFPQVTVTKSKKKGRKAPKKSLEQRLCEIFASVLNLSEVYADDNFFEMGGTSLSASKVTMMLMSENIEVKYGDIFDNPTPEELAEFVTRRDIANGNARSAANTQDNSDYERPTLMYNTVRYAADVERKPLGNVLLTGAVGFLGIHILKELLEIEKGHIWCLVRKGESETPEIRLKSMLIYYFSNGFSEELKNRITVLDADITDSSLFETLKDLPIDTVINCAACVKHFSDNDILERINVGGVNNLINICRKKNAKLIQISTVSVPGIHTKESYEKQVRMHENELFVIDDMDNKYGISKYHAELNMFDAIDDGLIGKVIRVGNLMGRHSDGEFQVNMETNMFMSGIRGFALMGKYPISHMTDPMRFSPVDCTARAVVLLAGTNDKFTAFNACNRYGFDEMKIIHACNRNGITILPEADEKYYEEFRAKLGNDKVNDKLNGLAAYDIKDAHAVDTDNLFTTNILYRIGFSWPLVDDAYLDKAINSIMTLDYFNVEDEE